MRSEVSPRKYSKSFLVLVNLAVLVLMVFLLEALSYFTLESLPILSQIVRNNKISGWHDERVGSDAYSDIEYAQKVFRDLSRVKEGYSPYILWRTESIQSETLVVDDEGNRQTCHSKEQGRRVFFFGGSTMFGTGVADCETIPSFAAILLQGEQKGGYEVTNFGTSAYQSTQQLIRLMMEIQRGNIPDWVVFYDGVNDVYAGAYSPGVPGLHHNFYQLSNRLSSGRWSRLVYDSNVYQLIQYLQERLIRRHQSWENNLDLVSNVTDTVNIYVQNVRILDAWSKQFGFRYLAVWQPVLLGSKKTPTAQEKVIIENSGRLLDIYTEAYRALSQVNMTQFQFQNLSGIFDGVEAPIYIDFNHLGPEGNRRVAERIVELIQSK